MELEYIFTPVDLKKINDWKELPAWSMGRLIERCNTKYGFDLSNIDIVVVGVGEDRNASHSEKGTATDQVRSMFYQLNNIDRNLRILDLGDLKLGNRLTDTYFCLREIAEYVLSKGASLIVIGGTQDLSVPLSDLLFSGYPGEMVVLDSKVDHEIGYELFDADHFLNGVSQDMLKRTTLLGYQNYLVDNRNKDFLERKGVQFVRLGQLRSQVGAFEPVMRDARLISFDTKCLRNGDFGGNYLPSPNGLYAQEACQLTYYSGLSNLSNMLLMSGFTGKGEQSKSDAMVVAQTMWHFVQGHWLSNNDMDLNDHRSMAYFDVEFSDTPYSLAFVKNIETERWWVAVVNSENEKGRYFACDKVDYDRACDNIISERVARLLNDH